MTEADRRHSRSNDPTIIKKSIPILIVAVLSGIVLLLYFVLPWRTDQVQAIAPPIVPVEVELIQPIPEVIDSFVVYATVEANRVVRVAAEVSGQIEKLGLRKTTVVSGGNTFPAGKPIGEGQPITRGQPIVLLNADLLQAEYNSVLKLIKKMPEQLRYTEYSSKEPQNELFNWIQALLKHKSIRE